MGDMHTTALSPTPLGSPLRAQFPILAQRINGQPLVYLDNAATTPVSYTHLTLPTNREV